MSMNSEQDKALLLGQQVPVSEHYAPELLYPIARSQARDSLGINSDELPFTGLDLWHAYELSWLDGLGRPTAFVGRFSVPAESPNLVESKSFKLYLNSLNQHRFTSPEAAVATICHDVGCAAGAEVALELFSVDDSALAGLSLPGECLDTLEVAWTGTAPQAEQLSCVSDSGTQTLYTHLLRSLCPVTGQPDWATLWLHMEGAQLETKSLLEYLLSYRNHQEFHEQCVERVFRDLQAVCQPSELHVQAFYTRRGGLDITPFRSTGGRQPLPRMNRQ